MSTCSDFEAEHLCGMAAVEKERRIMTREEWERWCYELNGNMHASDIIEDLLRMSNDWQASDAAFIDRIDELLSDRLDLHGTIDRLVKEIAERDKREKELQAEIERLKNTTLMYQRMTI